jgi:Bacterial pre-peptidase C-terminal domain
MTNKFSAAAIALSSSIALHVVPALADDGQYVADLYEGNSSGRTFFPAQKGADYILYAQGYGTVGIVNPTSSLSPVLNPNGNELEAQFRAAYTASYGLDVQTYNYAYGAVYTDCRDDKTTTCLLTTSRSQHGSMLTRGDRDWFRVSLTKGKRYQFALTSSYQQVTLTLRNPSGNLIQRSLNGTSGGTAYVNYKAPANGTYFAAASVVSYGTDYDLSVRPY